MMELVLAKLASLDLCVAQCTLAQVREGVWPNAHVREGV